MEHPKDFVLRARDKLAPLGILAWIQDATRLNLAREAAGEEPVVSRWKLAKAARHLAEIYESQDAGSSKFPD